MNKTLIAKLGISRYIESADSCLSAMNFTEHGYAHLTRVANMAHHILKELDYDEHTLELAEIACYMHDIGNVINRHDHAHSGAILAHNILLEKGYPLEDVLKIISAIGNHDENTGEPISEIAAALIIADKSDVRRSRVRSKNIDFRDIHTRVNYAVIDSCLDVDINTKVITLKMTLDTECSSVIEYFSIFTNRMKLCEKAAKTLGMNFCLQINDVKLMN